MNQIRSTVLVLMVTSAACHAVYSQSGTSTRSDPQTTNAALREKAFEVIDSVASQIGTLRSGENRARFGSNIADALWQRDEKRARALFISIEEDINAGLRNADDDQRVRSETLMVFHQLRINTVERIAKHDPEFAFSFLHPILKFSFPPRPGDRQIPSHRPARLPPASTRYDLFSEEDKPRHSPD